MKNLVIVESPAKAKTIEKYLGKDFKVLSSVGHIRSIPVKTPKGVKAIDTKNGFKTIYEVDPAKKKTITELKKAVKEAEEIWLATDEDREGEAIAWHLTEVLKLDPKTTKRIAFHEITKSAIEEAIKHPRVIDMKLVQAQQARQILDRLVGFDLSPVVWRKVPGGKSAGRVQSPAVRLLVEREQEIRDFQGDFDYRVTAKLEAKNEELSAELDKKLKTLEKSKEILQQLSSTTLTVAGIEKTPGLRNPQPPFTTSTLQQTANSKLGFSSKQTMSAAQKLYQAGKITYMRTDSVNLSSQSIAACKKFIDEKFGSEYSQIRKFKTKSANAQEAHEAIRPTDVFLEKASSNQYEQKLYELIRSQTLASQMTPAKIEKTTIKISGNNMKNSLLAKGEVVVFQGFLKAFSKSTKDKTLPNLIEGDEVNLLSAEARQTFKKAPARYSEGSLVKKLEELGIGRPSTYATIIDTIISREYATRGEGKTDQREINVLTLENNEIKEEKVTENYGSDKGKLVPQPIGELISKFLTEHFNNIVDYGFTAEIEEDFDEIARGELERNKMLKDFYEPFTKDIEKSDGIRRSDVSATREIGKDPKTGEPIFAKFGRFGPMLQLGSGEGDEKPRFAPMPRNKTVDTITLDQALEMFKLPRLVGQTRKNGLSEEGLDIKANIGRFGPYIQIGKLYVSIKPHDPRYITLEEAQELYEQKLQDEANKNVSQWGDIKVLIGRYGPYVTNGTKNVKIPKSTDPKSITEDEAKKMLENESKSTTKKKTIKKTTKPKKAKSSKKTKSSKK